MAENGELLPKRRRPRLTAKKTREAFLAALRQGFSVRSACNSIGLSRAQAYKFRERNPAFADAWDLAVDEGTDLLEDEALRRATVGVARPVFQGGKRVDKGELREYSDTLLIFLLKGRRPDKFRERVDHLNSDGSFRAFAEAMRQLELDHHDPQSPEPEKRTH